VAAAGLSNQFQPLNGGSVGAVRQFVVAIGLRQAFKPFTRTPINRSRWR
jgi:hypothetical protein